jgi:hypothetical protein
MSISSFDTVSGRRCYRVEFSVNSLESFAWVYKVEDHYLTYIDVYAIAPLKFEQHIREGTYRRDFIAEFDQAKHIAKTTEGSTPFRSMSTTSCRRSILCGPSISPATSRGK